MLRSALVKSVLSDDTVVLSGKVASPKDKAPVVIFTFEIFTTPRWHQKEIII